MGNEISKEELKWYGSNEHFNTEKSYEEHLEDLKLKKLANQDKKVINFLFGNKKWQPEH